MITSAFQFSKPVLISMEMKVNEKKPSELTKPADLIPRFSIEIGRHATEPMARVILHVAVGIGEDETPPYMIEASMASAFKWDATLSADAIEGMLSQNAVALLIAYIRPIISTVTGASQYPSYELPFIDVTSLKDENDAQ